MHNGHPHPVDVHVGRMIRAERIAQGMSQTQLGERIGVAFQQVQKYEKGVNRVSCSTLVKTAEALGIAPEFLLPTHKGQRPQDPEIMRLITLPGATKLLRAFAQLDSHCQGAVVISMLAFADALADRIGRAA
jgi:transcriptional regulator with XRE-family HTH domain